MFQGDDIVDLSALALFIYLLPEDLVNIYQIQM